MKAPRFLIPLLLGLLAVALVAAFFLLSNRPSQVRLEARILKVRTISTDDKASVVVAEVRMKNPSGYPFMLRAAHVKCVNAEGKEIDGENVSEMDLDRLLNYFKTVGPRYNPTFKLRDRIPAGAEIDRTVAASLPIAVSELNQRRNLIIQLEETDGVTVPVSERPASQQ